MAILRIGLIVGSLGCVYVAWASERAGFPIEVALVRGMVAFLGLTFVAYLGELVVATAPPAEQPADQDEAENAGQADSVQTAEGPAYRAAAATTPTALPVQSESDEQRAA